MNNQKLAENLEKRKKKELLENMKYLKIDTYTDEENDSSFSRCSLSSLSTTKAVIFKDPKGNLTHCKQNPVKNF